MRHALQSGCRCEPLYLLWAQVPLPALILVLDDDEASLLPSVDHFLLSLHLDARALKDIDRPHPRPQVVA